jgi:hypothetical protein
MPAASPMRAPPVFHEVFMKWDGLFMTFSRMLCYTQSELREAEGLRSSIMDQGGAMMSKVSVVQQTQVTDVRDVAAPFHFPDTASTAEVVLNEGLAFCARKMGLNDPKEVLQRLQLGDSSACQYCRYGLAKKAAESIGNLDDNIRSVYVLDYDATPHDLCFGQGAQRSPIHLIVWAQRKTDALASLVAALDRALAKKYATLIAAPDLVRMLDVQVVDNQDVEDCTGYGALLSSTHNRPIKVWER